MTVNDHSDDIEVGLRDSWLRDVLMFRRMLTPWLVRISFLVGSLFLVALGVSLMSNAGGWRGDRIEDVSFWIGLAMTVLGPLGLRLTLEQIVVLHQINESLTDIRKVGMTK